MQEHTFDIQRIMGGAVHYNRWIYTTLAPFLGQRILDVGSGFGHITAHFLEAPRERVVSVDLEPEYVAALRARFATHANFEAICGDATAFDPVAPDRTGFDTVTCVNVLEHVEDDGRLLAAFASMLVPGGRVALFVPALEWLYGSMDRADGHFRRYTPRSVSKALEAAGLEVVHCRFFNALGILGWFVNGRILRRTLVPSGQLGLFDRLVPFLARLEATVPPPLGQSLVAVGRKG